MSLQGLNNLKYGLLKEYYYKYCNEISLKHSIPDWYEDLMKYLLEEVDDKVFVRIRLMKYTNECSLKSPVYTLGNTGKGTSGHLFKQTSNFILCCIHTPCYVLEPIKSIPFDPDIDPINYTLVDLQTSIHFVNEHHNTINYLNTLYVYILDSNEDSNEVRRRLMSH